MVHTPQLSITCSDSLATYGTTCTLACTSGYSMVGSAEAVCDRANQYSSVGYWNFGVGGHQPYCEEGEDIPTKIT